jgi:hypothetical protein
MTNRLMSVLDRYFVSTSWYNIDMPNAPKTPTRTLRVDDELWQAVQEQARVDGITVTSIIIDGLYGYLKDARERQSGVLE